MADNKVSFTITADTKDAGKAILQLQKELKGLSNVKSNNAETQTQLDTFKKISATLGDILKKEKDQGRNYKKWEDNAKQIDVYSKELVNAKQKLAEFTALRNELQAKKDSGATLTTAETANLSRYEQSLAYWEKEQARAQAGISKYKEKNATLDEHAKAALTGLVEQYGEIKTDENSILGLTVGATKETESAAQAARQNADATQDAVDATNRLTSANKNLNDTTTTTAERATGEDTTKATDSVQTAKEAEVVLANLKTKIGEILNFDRANADITELMRHLMQLQAAENILKKLNLPPELDTEFKAIHQDIILTTAAIREYDSAFKQTTKDTTTSAKGTTSAIRLIARGMTNLKSAIADSSKNIKSAIGGMSRNLKSNFKHMLTSLTKYVFGFRSLFFLVRRLRKYIGEGIQSMAKFNGGNNSVNANISKLITSLEYLKNAWATAFDPILQFVTPMLTYLLDKLAGVGNAVSRFLGNLLGASKVFQAVKGPTKNYAKSLDKTGKSAGGAAKKQKQLNDRLADFDDLHVLGKDNPTKGSGGGSGSGNDDEEKKRNNKLWDFAKIGNDIKEWMQKMWEDADFTQLGEKLASGLRRVFENLNDKMPEILKNANKVGKSIATFLNGLLSDPQLFTEMGKAAANLGNILVQTLAGFFEKYKPGRIGSAIANFFRGIFQNFDWKTAGQNLGNFVSTFFTELATLFKEFPVDDFLKGLKAFFEGIDWGAVVKSLFDFLAASASLLGNLLKGLGDIISQIKAEDIVEAFKKVDWEAVGKGFGDLLAGVIAITLASVKIGFELAKAICTGIANAWIQAMKDAGVWDKFVEGVKSGDWSNAGGALIEGLVDGIGKAFGNAADWVKRYLIDPIVENFKALFGIHSPSTVTEEWGVYLIQGLANGISKTIGLITQKWEEFKTNTATALGLVKDKIIEIWLGIEAGLKKPVNGIIGIVESCINKMISGINAIAKKLNSLPSLEFTNPFTGKDYKLGFKIPELSKVSIPRLAQGAVIPPNKEFMAMLGDQSHGTNIEAPLDTIKQAVAEVMANNGNAEVIQLLQQLIAVVQSKNLVIGDKEIGKANARYNNQQRIIRGTSF